MIDEDDIPTGEVDVDDEPEAAAAGRFGLDDLLDFQELADEIIAHEHTRLLDFEMYKPAPDIVVSTIESGLGQTLPDFILSFYQKVSDGLDLKWSYDLDGDEVPGGQIGLLNFARVFGTWLDELWGVYSDETREDFSWEIRGVERKTTQMGNLQTVIHYSEITREFALYYYDPHGAAHVLDADFPTYIRRLLTSRGFYGWQYLISDVNFEDHTEAQNIAETFFRVMPELFPDINLDGFRKP